nr:ankyrin repeat protein [Cedratvirus plubellavi]
MEIVYRTIFSFSEGYNFRNRQVCFEFRQLAPKIRGCVYLNQILKDGRGAIFTERRDMVVICIELGLFALLEVCRKYIPADVCNIAAEKNNLSSLKWCMRQGYKLDGFIYHYIAKNNNLEMAKWVKSDPGIFWSCSAVICSYAAQEGRLEMLQWMRQEGFPWDESTCTGAAYYGHLEVLKWARTNDWFYRKAIKFFTKHGFVKNLLERKHLYSCCHRRTSRGSKVGTFMGLPLGCKYLP